jgi:integrase
VTTAPVRYPTATLYPRRDRGGEFYVDFSRWSPVAGARRGPLYIDDRGTKTRDRGAAAEAYTTLLAVMQARWREHLGLGDTFAEELVKRGLHPTNPLMRDFALRIHLPEKRSSVARSTLRREVGALKAFLRTLPAGLRMKQMSPACVDRYVSCRRDMGIAESTVAVELSALSELARTGMAWGLLDANPVRSIRWRPRRSRHERPYLESYEAAEVLTAARRWDERATDGASPFMEALLACHLVQGCRDEEARGLLRRDVDLDAGRLLIRPNAFRGIKRDHQCRVLPLWPQARSAMERHLFAPGDSGRLVERFAPTDPIFPGRRGGIVRDVRVAYWRILVDAGLATLRDPDDASRGIHEHITFHTLRHTYCAARLQTLDRGAPVQQHTVMAELGHRDYKLVAELYGHVHLAAPRREHVLFEPR